MAEHTRIRLAIDGLIDRLADLEARYGPAARVEGGHRLLGELVADAGNLGAYAAEHYSRAYAARFPLPEAAMATRGEPAD